MRRFPKGSSRDLVDTLTQLLIWLKSYNYVRNPTDIDFDIEEQQVKKQERIY
jgi:hypothetical protein